VHIVDLARNAAVTTVLQDYRSFASMMYAPIGDRIEFEAALREESAFSPYIFDVRRNAVTRLQIDGRMNATGWNPTGDSLFYATSALEIMSRAIDGSGASTRILRPRDWKLSGGHIAAWGPWLAFSATSTTGGDVSRIVVAHRDSLGVARALDASQYSEYDPTISPDGKWLAFMSRENGHPDIFVAAFPRAQGRFLVSTKGGESPRWGRDSRTLYFSSGNQIMSASVSGDTPPRIGVPAVLYQRDPWGTFDIAPDGKSLIFIDRAREGEPQSLLVNLHALSGH
jgi:Tol biopolymer transport system component